MTNRDLLNFDNLKKIIEKLEKDKQELEKDKQELEKDKQELVDEIAIILQEKWTLKKATTIEKWKFKFEFEKRIQEGSINAFRGIGGGIISQIQNKQR